MKAETAYRLEQEWARLWQTGQAIALLLARQPATRAALQEQLLRSVPPDCRVIRLPGEGRSLGASVLRQLSASDGSALDGNLLDCVAQLPQQPIVLAVAAERLSVPELDELRQFMLALLASGRPAGLLLAAPPGFARVLQKPQLRGLRQLIFKQWSLDPDPRGYLVVTVALATLFLLLLWLPKWRQPPAEPVLVPQPSAEVAVPVTPLPPQVMRFETELHWPAVSASGTSGG